MGKIGARESIEQRLPKLEISGQALGWREGRAGQIQVNTHMVSQPVTIGTYRFTAWHVTYILFKPCDI